MTFNAAEWLIDRHLAEGGGDRIAVDTPSGTTTYAELSELTGKVAAGLRSLGLRRDDRIVFVANDDLPSFSGILGAFRGGFVAIPVSTMFGPQELTTVIADSGAQVVCASAAFAPQVAAAAQNCPELRTIIWDGDPGDVTLPERVSSMPFDDVVSAGAAADEAERAVVPTDEDAWALWLYTSGTTGKPKGAMHRHANIRHVVETYGKQVLQIQPNDRCLSVAKLFFAYGIGNSMFFPLAVGATTVLEPARSTPAGMVERIRAGAPTLFFGVPTFFAGLVASSDIPDDIFAGIRYSASAGEALPKPLQQKVKQRFGLDILDGIGSTECLHIFLSNSPGDIREGTTGKPVPGYDIVLRDSDGNLLGDGEPGTLYVRGESIALGYWRRTDASRQVFQGEWVNTGDTYVRDEDGYYTCLGRSGDMLKAGGMWVSPAEVESRLLAHDAVLECVVVALPDHEGIDKPVACVITQGEVTEDELDAWCRAGLAAFKRPRRVYFVDEIPKTATGKLQRYKVREIVHAIEYGSP
ncbi:MAG: benzoate-CoA ligase family protein [Tetrasphaera sp.]